MAAGVLLHLALDTVAGGIYWLYPFSTEELRWVDVPAVQGWWVANSVLHWSFALERVPLAVSLGLRRSAVARSIP